MLRRQNRLRREFLYKKDTAAREAATVQRKQANKDAKQAIATAAKGKEKQVTRAGAVAGAPEANGTEDIDDEYGLAGVQDPKILVTTSRDPSSRLAQFAKEIRLVLPNTTRINRGGTVMKEMADACRTNDFTDLVVLHEHRGQPDAMVVSHFPHGPTTMFTLHNVVLRHDIASHASSTVSEQYPHLIFDGFSSKLGARVQNVLKYLFPVPSEDSKRVMTFANENDFITFRHHVYVKNSHREVQLAEVGPRFQMRPYEIRQGTIEQTEADVEWVLRPYQRTAKKRSQL
ncbi:MAG: snoRNA-binding rRNA-processing protein imp4 [Cyphobasidiales sp. Tagirdzhanova-0007]|nr:MAG: snoRNA-binding rRNA-processing protein imp4 [Cyphobasidiales sp. Tagirdzhanova-0007]